LLRSAIAPEFHRDSFDLVPRPRRFTLTAAAAFRIARRNDEGHILSNVSKGNFN
jgi:hypothetical protein